MVYHFIILYHQFSSIFPFSLPFEPRTLFMTLLPFVLFCGFVFFSLTASPTSELRTYKLGSTERDRLRLQETVEQSMASWTFLGHLKDKDFGWLVFKDGNCLGLVLKWILTYFDPMSYWYTWRPVPVISPISQARPLGLRSITAIERTPGTNCSTAERGTIWNLQTGQSWSVMVSRSGDLNPSHRSCDLRKGTKRFSSFFLAGTTQRGHGKPVVVPWPFFVWHQASLPTASVAAPMASLERPEHRLGGKLPILTFQKSSGWLIGFHWRNPLETIHLYSYDFCMSRNPGGPTESSQAIQISVPIRGRSSEWGPTPLHVVEIVLKSWRSSPWRVFSWVNWATYHLFRVFLGIIFVLERGDER